MSKYWRILLTPLYPLLAVNVVVALIYIFAWCRPHSWKWMSGTLTFLSSRMVGNPGGQGWSPIVGYANEECRQWAVLRAHENTHVWQELVWAAGGLLVAVPLAALGWWLPATIAAFSGGVVWMLAYVGHFLVNFARLGFQDWDTAYRNIVFEKHAYRVDAEFEAGKRPNAWI